MMGKQIRLVEGKLIVEDVQELPLYPADVALAKHAGAQRPVNVLQRGVIAVLVCANERSQKYTLACPLLECDLEVRLRPVDVDEGNEEDGDLDLGFGEDVGHEVEEVCVCGMTRDRAAP